MGVLHLRHDVHYFSFYPAPSLNPILACEIRWHRRHLGRQRCSKTKRTLDTDRDNLSTYRNNLITHRNMEEQH